MGSRPKNLSQAIEELGRAAGKTGDDLKSKATGEIENLEETLEKLKPRLEELKRTAGEEALNAKATVENEMRKNPWAAVGIAGVVFFILGFIFASRGKRND